MTFMNLAALVVTSGASLFGCLFAAAKIVGGLKRRWIAEEDHIRALQELTGRVQDLTGQLRKLTETVADHTRRLDGGGL